MLTASALTALMLSGAGAAMFQSGVADADPVTLPSGTVITVVGRNANNYYSITVDGPVTDIYVTNQESLNGDGAACTADGGSSDVPRSVPNYHASCTGPGMVYGFARAPILLDCNPDTLTWNGYTFTVMAEGLIVYQEPSLVGQPCELPTTTTVLPTTTTTVAPTTTTTNNTGTTVRHCIRYAYKPFKHCVAWSS